MLFDSGSGTIRRLLETGTSIDDVAYIFYSHLHPDHTAELVPFLFATKYPYGNRRKAPLTIIAGKGFAQFYDGLKTVYGSWMEFEPGELNIIEVRDTGRDHLECEDFTVDSIPVAHRPESVAFRITDGCGMSVVYSGDTDFSQNLIRLSADAELLICEAALPDEFKAEGHLTPSEAGELAARANVGKLVLTHFYPECDRIDMAAQCRKTYAGPLILAEDLMRITLC